MADKLGTTEANLLLGDAYMSIQEPERAMEIYETVLRKDPNDARLASKMGQALMKTHNYAKAVSYYEAAVKGGQKALQWDLADLLIKLKHHEKAKRLLFSLVNHDTAEPSGLFIVFIGETSAAVIAFRLTLHSSPHQQIRPLLVFLRLSHNMFW
ncbi:unnamed protein product [Dicrocoelium dendriticum]|nr:unnamed protein product [Dicrocoelium dendriticum]